MDYLKGKKTYIAAGLGAVVALGWLLGLIDEATANQLLALLGFGGLAALRAGMVNAVTNAKP